MYISNLLHTRAFFGCKGVQIRSYMLYIKCFLVVKTKVRILFLLYKKYIEQPVYEVSDLEI